MHASSLLHAVSRIRAGVRYALIVFYHDAHDDGGADSAAGASGAAASGGLSAEARRQTHGYLVAGVEDAAAGTAENEKESSFPRSFRSFGNRRN